MREGLLTYPGGYEWNAGEAEAGDGARSPLHWGGSAIRL